MGLSGSAVRLFAMPVRLEQAVQIRDWFKQDLRQALRLALGPEVASESLVEAHQCQAACYLLLPQRKAASLGKPSAPCLMHTHCAGA